MTYDYKVLNISETSNGGSFKHEYQYTFKPTTSGSVSSPVVNLDNATVKNTNLNFTFRSVQPTNDTQPIDTLSDVDELEVVQNISQLTKQVIGQQTS